MKHAILLLSLLFAASVLADAPNQLRLTDYQKLWTDSPFTSKPPPPPPPDAPPNPLEDYALGGISKLADGYYAILLNKKDPSDKVVIRPGSDGDYKVVDVQWSEGNWKDTVVTVQSGSQRGTVAFEDKLLAVKTAAPATPQKPQQPAARPATPAQPAQPASAGGRQPRPRIVRPPTPSRDSSGGRGR
ncbi:hypothetical protein HAHE_39470 [Haloferula helveola]|uniref:Uncharacterized protein n=1 Tax=Haloferula helveola TaxID=490095 RepID=A0ABN6HEZ1_9BACT|nr:hypothetical protein HAHE_39470 [Haloferula helveola]